MTTLSDKITYGEKYGPAMVESLTQDEADSYFERLVEHQMRVGGYDRTEAEGIERSNLGYWAGYYDAATRLRVERLFHCEHPVYGSMEKNGWPDPRAAYDAGRAAGSQSR